VISVECWSELPDAVRSQLPDLLLEYHQRTEQEKALGREPSASDPSADATIPPRYQEEVDHPATRFADDTVLLAVDGPLALGCVVLTPGPSPEVKRLWVATTARRRGIATLLLDAVLRVAEARGDREVRLSVWSWRTGAIALYGRSGFVPAASWDDRPSLSCLRRDLS